MCCAKSQIHNLLYIMQHAEKPALPVFTKFDVNKHSVLVGAGPRAERYLKDNGAVVISRTGSSSLTKEKVNEGFTRVCQCLN